MNDIPYLTRRTQHRIGDTGRSSEKRLRKELLGRARPASGAFEGAKGDIELGRFLIEAKSTVRDSLGVKLDWLFKISKEARAEGKTPILSVSFTNAAGAPYHDGEWALVPMHVFKELLGWA